MKKYLHSYTLFFSIIILSSLLFYSCSKMFYVPNTQNVPAFTKVNELQIKACVNDNLSAVELQSAYSVINHLGVIANGSFFTDKYSKIGNGYFLEFGTGCFVSPYPNLVLELYGGGGKRITTFDYYANSYKMQVTYNFTRYFAQGNIGILYHEGKTIFSTRISQFNFINYTTTHPNFITSMSIQDLEKVKEFANEIFIEPAITIKWGDEYVNTHIQLQMSINTDQRLRLIPSDKFLFSAGLCFNISTRKKTNP